MKRLEVKDREPETDFFRGSAVWEENKLLRRGGTQGTERSDVGWVTARMSQQNEEDDRARH